MTVLGLTCQNKGCTAFGEPLSEVWGSTWGKPEPKLIEVFCDCCHYSEFDLVSSDMGNEAWTETPKRPQPLKALPLRGNPSRGGAKMEHRWLFFLFLIVMVGMVGLFVWMIDQKKDDPQFETITVDGVRCIYDNVQDEIASCDWGPR